MPPARLHGLFSVRTRLLAAVAKWATTDESRPFLERVLFDGKHIVATDGHRIVAVPCETDVPPFTVHRVDCAILAAAQREIGHKRHADSVFVTVSDGKAAIDIDEGRRVLTVKVHDAKDFPPWEVLFGELKAESAEPPSFAFEPRYLAGIDEVLEAVDGSCQRTATVKAWSSGKFIGPMLFEGEGIRFLIMPKRTSQP